MLIRAAQEADALALGHLMVDTYLRTHKGQVPDEVWYNRQAEWTPEVSAQAWARTLRDIADSSSSRECLYVAVAPAQDETGARIVGLIMGGPTEFGPWPAAGDIYALYIHTDYHRRGVGRHLVGVAAHHLAQLGMTALIIRSLPANTPANGFYAALGGQLIGECATEEYGYQIPERIYGWADSAPLRLTLEQANF